jgi:hypothetical protein
VLMKQAITLAATMILAASSVKAFAQASSADSANTKPAYTTAPMPVTTPNRSVFMNGVDISSARNQDLRNVHIKISENGDIFIAGPQYQVTEEETFMPLSSYTGKSQPPAHKAPQELNSGAPKTAKSALDGMGSDKSAAAPAANPATTPPAAATQPAQPASANAPKTGG